MKIERFVQLSKRRQLTEVKRIFREIKYLEEETYNLESILKSVRIDNAAKPLLNNFYVDLCHHNEIAVRKLLERQRRTEHVINKIGSATKKYISCLKRYNRLLERRKNKTISLKKMVLVFLDLSETNNQVEIDYEKSVVHVYTWEEKKFVGNFNKNQVLHGHYGIELDTELIFFRDYQPESQNEKLGFKNWLKYRLLT